MLNLEIFLFIKLTISVNKYVHGKLPQKYLQNKECFVTKVGKLGRTLSLLPQYAFVIHK